MKPNTKRGICLLSLVLVCAWPEFSVGQTQARMKNEELMTMRAQVSARLQQHHVRIKGNEQPNAVPFPAQMRSFVGSLQSRAMNREELAAAIRTKIALTPTDAERLADAVATAASPAGLAELSAHTTRVSEALARTDDSVEVIKLAEELDKIQERADQLWQVHFETLLSTLSGDGRRTTLEYLHREIAPRVTYIRTDHVGLYSEFLQLRPQIKTLEQAGLARLPLQVHTQAEDAASASGDDAAFVGRSTSD